MIVIKVAAMSCVMLTGLCSPSLAMNCWGPTVSTLGNQTVQGQMFVVAGKRCAMKLRMSHGPMLNAQVLEQPSHGSATVRGLQVIYSPRAGYIGEDRFVYAWKGLDPLNRPRTNTVEMRVQVSQKL
ncbi:Ig-like domain-containing protein [Bradyrhizobium sp. ORS 285]|uniref:Ig-like domain-containing protein n=1 Tax=Bradyrhizobium sp. ORS 285 TaxID=115808 RepID=UPI0007C69EEF|nr:Ig-like domain-containing protein [Bradyrhizobium sp. ORS 285]